MDTMGHYVDGLKFAGGSFSLMPREAVKQMTSIAHKHNVYVSTGGWAEYVLAKGPKYFKPYLQVLSLLHTYMPPSISQPESISTQARIPRTSTVAQTVSQTRFQGIWWGTERIWTDELVRLKIALCQFAPKGTGMIYPPAGPSPSTLESDPEAAADPQRLGASEKGLFLRLEGLFVVDVPNAEGRV